MTTALTPFVKDELVVKHNKLIESRHSLSSTQNRLVTMMISKIEPADEDFKPYKIRIAELLKRSETKSKDMYSYCRNETRNLLEKTYEIIEENGNLLQIGIISSARYFNGCGEFEVRFDPSLKPYLLQLKSHFTQYSLAQMLKFKSSYAQRFYEFLSRYRSTGWWEVEVKELKIILKLDNKYEAYNMFEKRVIKRAEMELSNTDMAFTYKVIKKVKRNVERLRFELKQKKQKFIVTEENESIYKKLVERFRLTPEQAKKVIAVVPNQVIQKTLYDIMLMNSNNQIGNLPAYTIGSFQKMYSKEFAQMELPLNVN